MTPVGDLELTGLLHSGGLSCTGGGDPLCVCWEGRLDHLASLSVSDWLVCQNLTNHSLCHIPEETGDGLRLCVKSSFLAVNQKFVSLIKANLVEI